ncbi:interferon lambda-4-like [Mustela lutreola]|uniref:interferon lambda-4-like n=1 Tax=Mustela lutreola TaxID=9666 RepID=UPI002797A81B|nr:interferon lambda-4-like [Mustela lutreola]
MAVALWVLVTAIEVADPCVATPRRCLLSHYRSLDPRALAAVKALRDRYVSDAQTSPPGPPSPRARRAPAADPGVRRPWRSSALAPRRAARISGQDSEQQMLPAAAGASGSTDPASGPVPRGRPLQAGWAPPRAKWLPAQGQASRGAFSQRPRLARAARFRVQSAQPSWPGAFHVQESPPPQRFGGLARRPSLTPALVPQEEETLSWRPRNCSFRPRRDRPRPWSCARLRVVVRDLADAQAVLSRLPSPDRFPGTGRTLELLAAARRDVGACLELVRPGSWRKSLRPPRRRPPTRRADSPRCHEANVIFNLLRLLTWDLKLVANSGPCL